MKAADRCELGSQRLALLPSCQVLPSLALLRDEREEDDEEGSYPLRRCADGETNDGQ